MNDFGLAWLVYYLGFPTLICRYMDMRIPLIGVGSVRYLTM